MDFHNEKRIENQNPEKNMHEWRRWRKRGWHREEKQNKQNNTQNTHTKWNRNRKPSKGEAIIQNWRIGHT